MNKFSKKMCLLVAGAGLGCAWTTPATAASPLVDRADVVFADDTSDGGFQLVDYQSRMQRQYERDCRAQLRDQERLARRSEKDRARACRPDRCRDGAGGMWDSGCSLFSGCGDWFGGCDVFGGGGCGFGSCMTDELGDPWTVSGAIADSLCLDEPCINVGGWAQFGYTNESDGVFNTRPDALNNHQTWLYVEKVADGSNGVGFGGRFDAVYGLDGGNTQAFGNNPGRWDFQNGFDHGQFAFALPQAYGQIAYEDLSVKVGHFYTLQGYEVVGATGNFFYSHALTFNFMEPFTHTGAVATYTVSDDVEVYFGYVLGWDTGFDQFDGGSAYHGGIKLGLMDNMDLVFTQTIGDLGFIGDGYSQSIVVSTNVTDELTSVIGGDVVHTNEQVLVGPAGAPVAGNTFNGLSVYNYLIYAISDRTGVGMRNEWSKFDGVSYHTFTAGVNYRPHANVVIRPEYRRQYSPAGDNDRNNPLGIPVNESILGVDAIVTF